jgi:thioredoxin-dependent peroxiredoxin
VEILGISFDTVPENAAFAKKFDFNFPCLSDTTRAVGMAYGACDEPQARSAKRITYVIGPDGRVLNVYPKVNAAAHPEQILKDL